MTPERDRVVDYWWSQHPVDGKKFILTIEGDPSVAYRVCLYGPFWRELITCGDLPLDVARGVAEAFRCGAIRGSTVYRFTEPQ